MSHVPVMLAETIELLDPRPGGRYVDGTLGNAGHAEIVLERSAPDGELLAVDRDPGAIARSKRRLAAHAERVHFRQASYADVGEILAALGWDGADGILVDLGVSSEQLDDAERGFSFSKPGPLDMRMDTSRGATAIEWLSSVDERDLARVLRRYGEERHARRIAHAIVEAVRDDRVRDTAALAEIVESRSPQRGPRRIHPATRTFQAIRIAVNDELAELEKFLAETWQWLRPGGRLVVLAYHSLEDRLVKEAFRGWARACTCPRDVPVCRCGGVARVRLLTRKALRPSDEETERNPRSRSARLRAVERLAA